MKNLEKWTKKTNKFKNREKRYEALGNMFINYKLVLNLIDRLSNHNFKKWNDFLFKKTDIEFICMETGWDEEFVKELKDKYK